MKNRVELAKFFFDLGFKVGAEIGVESGRYSKIICENNPGVKLFCIDFWEPYEELNDYRLKSTLEQMYENSKRRLRYFDCHLIKDKSMNAVKNFADECLDFVYIDSNHKYEFVKEDIREWTKKVRKGGVVSGHDYATLPGRDLGVIQAVDEYVKEHGYQLKLTGIEGTPDHSCPSWYFIK